MNIMQTTMEIADAQMTVVALLDGLTPGDEVIFTRKHLPVAKLIIDESKTSQTSCPRTLQRNADDRF